MNKQPYVHPFHTRLQRLELRSFKCFIDQSVLRDDEFRCFRERFSEVLKLLHGEAFVVDSGEEVAVFELVSDGFDGFFFLCARDCGGDGREETVGFENGFWFE